MNGSGLFIGIFLRRVGKSLLRIGFDLGLGLGGSGCGFGGFGVGPGDFGVGFSLFEFGLAGIGLGFGGFEVGPCELDFGPVFRADLGQFTKPGLFDLLKFGFEFGSEFGLFGE